MSVIRKDIFSGQMVIFASNRKDKPYNYKSRGKVEEKENQICPFCVGNEGYTTPTLFEVKENENEWKIRVFENMYPAVSIDKFDEDKDKFYESMAGKGIHEIIVDTPVHTMDTSDFSNEHFAKVFKVIAKRYENMMHNENVEYVQIFKNNGPMAGASITHSHWQVMGVPFMPDEQKKSISSYNEYFEKTGKCLMCDVVYHEKKEDKRVIEKNNHFTAFSPYASRQAFEIWIVPERHVSSVVDLTEDEFYSLSEMFKDMVKRVMGIRENVSFNVCFQECPKSADKSKFHWSMRILPRIGSWAGYEFATQSIINPVLPEIAAEIYKKHT